MLLAFITSTWEAEAGKSLWVQGHPDLQRESRQPGLDTENLYVGKKKKKKLLWVPISSIPSMWPQRIVIQDFFNSILKYGVHASCCAPVFRSKPASRKHYSVASASAPASRFLLEFLPWLPFLMCGKSSKATIWTTLQLVVFTPSDGRVPPALFFSRKWHNYRGGQ